MGGSQKNSYGMLELEADEFKALIEEAVDHEKGNAWK